MLELTEVDGLIDDEIELDMLLDGEDDNELDIEVEGLEEMLLLGEEETDEDKLDEGLTEELENLKQN